MKNNAELKRDIQESIRWVPLLDTAEIAVNADNGIVTLSGTVDSWIKKKVAENTAKYVAGVNAVIDKIVIKLKKDLLKKDDEDIAREIINVFKKNGQIPSDKILVNVENGWITLEGEVEWSYQREAARAAVINLLDVVGVSNNITIMAQMKNQIELKVNNVYLKVE